jgi:hypothetical protein
MADDDLEKLNKKVKEQFDKFTTSFNNLFGIKKPTKETEKDESEAEAPKEDISKQAQENWNKFASGIMDGFQNLKKSFEEQNKEFISQSEENKNQFNQFFANMKSKWDTQIAKWKGDIESKQAETKQEWDSKMHKLKDDYSKWREQQKQEFKEGMKDFSRASMKGAWQFLIFMIPVIIVLAIIMWILSLVLPGFT